MNVQRKKSVGSVAGGAVKATAKGTFKIIAFVLNLFVPGLGTFFVGRIGTAIIQLLLLVIGVVTIAFGGIGFLIILGDWIWALVTVVQAGRKPTTVYVVQQAPPK